jgi:hypothetical protein
MNNWRKHEEDRGELAKTWNVDPFSTGIVFTGWKERAGEPFLWKWRDTYEPLIVYLPKTWLLSEGWKRSKCGSCSSGGRFRDAFDATLYCRSCDERSARRLRRAARTSSISSQHAL